MFARMFEGMDVGRSPALEVLSDLGSVLDRAQKVLGEGLWRCSEPELREALAVLHRCNARSMSLQLAVTREVDVRGVPQSVGAVSLRAFLGHALTMSPALSGVHAKLSEALATRFTDTGDALAAGEISLEQAKAIVDTVNGLPKCADGEDKAKAQAYLLEHAPVWNATDIRSVGKIIDAVIDPDGTPDREEAARSKRGAGFRDHHDGTQTLTWTDIDENIALVKAAIGALDAPAPAEDGTRDPRSASVRRADALLEVCRRVLDSGGLPGSRGVRPHLHVTFTEETLRGERGAPHGRTSTGENLSPATIGRLLCDAALTGILLDGAGVPLKLGRTVRTVQPGQWIALVARDTGCQFPACTRPAAWCEAHSEDGSTDLAAGGLTEAENTTPLGCPQSRGRLKWRGRLFGAAPESPV